MPGTRPASVGALLASVTWMSFLCFIAGLPRRLLMGAVSVYQAVISPLKPPCCRFVPTCSQYAKEAIAVHGACRGTMLAAWRILRCHPFYHGPLYDPVPPKREGSGK